MPFLACMTKGVATWLTSDQQVSVSVCFILGRYILVPNQDNIHILQWILWMTILGGLFIP